MKPVSVQNYETFDLNVARDFCNQSPIVFSAYPGSLSGRCLAVDMRGREWVCGSGGGVVSCTGFLCSSTSCSRLQLSSTGPCPAMPLVTWLTTVRSSPTLVSDNCVLSTLEHSLSVGRPWRFQLPPIPTICH